MLQDLRPSCVQAQLNTHCTAPGSQQCPSQQLFLAQGHAAGPSWQHWQLAANCHLSLSPLAVMLQRHDSSQEGS